MKDFKKLKMWQCAMDISDTVFNIYEPLPWQQVTELKSRSVRAAVSIASNIAEGNSRKSEKDKHRFMEIALGSGFELETQVLILQRRNWCAETDLNKLLQAIDEE